MTNTERTKMLSLMFVRTLGLTVGLALLAYLVFTLALYLGQYKVLYHPHRYSFTEAVKRATELGLSPWPLSANDLHGYLAQQPPESPVGTLLVFHGNAGSALDRINYVSDMQAHGFRVVLVEYPAYGPRPGQLGETSLVSAARSTAQAAVEAFPEPVYVLGESLGCGIACAVAADPTCKVSGLLLITPWDSLPNLAQDRYPFFPTRYLARDTYDNIANLQAFTGPMGIVLAEQDEIIPPPRTQALATALGDRARLWTLTGVGHNNWEYAVSPAWWEQIAFFLRGQS